MPINPATATTAPTSHIASEPAERNDIPLLAYQPHFLHDYLQGGCTIDAATVPADGDGQKWAYKGDIYRRNETTKLWDLISVANPATPADNGQPCVMLEHDLNCTGGNQSFNGLLQSQHVNRGALRRPIPTFLVGPNKQFQYKFRSFLDTRG